MKRSNRTSMEGSAIPYFFYALSSILIISNALDTITKTQFITDDKTIVLSSESFELGFFSPGDSNYRYLGIWYKKISTGTVVWVANRETPIADKSGVLKVIDPGILVLVNGTNNIIWSTNTSISAQYPVARLLDSGNLVVNDEKNPEAEHLLWQSFDYPGDTFLPGMKLGKNLVTGREWYLSSWKSKDDPAQGQYTYGLDLHGYPQIVLSNGSTEQFRSGPWNGVRFSGPHLRPNPIYKYGVVFKNDEVYYSYELVNSSVVSRFVLNPNGIGERSTWIDQTHRWVLYLTVPQDTCDTYELCGPNGVCNIDKSPVCGCLSNKFVPKDPKNWDVTDWSSGCVRRTLMDCHSDGFVRFSGIKMADTRKSWYNTTMTLEECREECLKNCSCTAFTNLDVRRGGSGCLLWFRDLIDLRVFSDNGLDIYIRMASSDLGQQLVYHGNKRTIIVVSLALLSGMLLLALSIAFYIRQKKKKKLPLKREGHMEHNSEQPYPNKSQKEDLELPLFDFATIADSTDNFSINNKIGEGGFGPVYKGILDGGQEIAVKRLSEDSAQGLIEFKNEVICIAKLQHRNLVKLLGCCIQGEEKMLIYEYMPNKSLDYFIFDQTQRMLLDWPKRFQIINGIARGILYLHQDSRLRIIHRDLKASNILLDIGMNPKISDFGMARSFGGNEMATKTKRVVGTYGYMSPEYALDGLFSVKSDVFSFGVLVLEIMSGKRNRGFNHPDHHLNLLGHAWILYKEGRSMELIDETLRDSCELFEVLRSINVGLLCVQQCPEDRPSMSTVILMLGIEGALPQPKQPGFFTERNLLEADSSSSKGAMISVNEITISLLDAR